MFISVKKTGDNHLWVSSNEQQSPAITTSCQKYTYDASCVYMCECVLHREVCSGEKAVGCRLIAEHN